MPFYQGNLHPLLLDMSTRLQKSPISILNDAIMTFYGKYVRVRYRNVLRKNLHFKNIYSKNDRCFIVGNVPSLTKQDLSLLVNEHVFVVNWFYKHELFHEISPEYYSFISPFGLIEYKYGPSRFSWWRELDEALTKNHGRTKLFLPLNLMDFCAKNHLFKNVDVYYLFPCLGIKYGIKKIDLTGPIYGLNSVLSSMLLAYYMGFRNMILIGCDCSWAAEPDKYGEQVDGEHFYPEGSESIYFGDSRRYTKSEWRERVRRATSGLFEDYRVIKNFLASKECKVYNATHGGFLDIFPRVEYEKLFK